MKSPFYHTYMRVLCSLFLDQVDFCCKEYNFPFPAIPYLFTIIMIISVQIYKFALKNVFFFCILFFFHKYCKKKSSIWTVHISLKKLFLEIALYVK